MAHPSKRKAKRHELEVTNLAKEAGLKAERAWNSNGQSLGEAEECDVLIADSVRAQCKRRKRIAQYLPPPDGADVTIVREDRADNLVILPLDDFLDLLRDAK